MALFSRHFKVATAIKDSLTADTDLTAQVPAARWRIQKRAYHRYQRWESGAHVVPMSRSYPAHENACEKIVFPTLVTVVWPGSDGELQAQLEPRLGVQERIEKIFNRKGRTKAPAPVLALDSAGSGDDLFSFEQSLVEPGEAFMPGAFEQGLDVIAVVVVVECIADKVDYSSLGA